METCRRRRPSHSTIDHPAAKGESLRPFVPLKQENSGLRRCSPRSIDRREVPDSQLDVVNVSRLDF
jgi:hypothetical protein